MVTEEEIGKIIAILKKEMKKYKEPAVTQVSHTRDPFKVLVSCILSLRTRDSTTEKASGRLFAIADNPADMLKIATRKIAKAIYPVSFYRVKSKAIKQICKDILEKYSGKVPDAMDELLSFRGVGRKTANIVMVYGFHRQGLPIDTHCHRIPNRLGWIKTKTPEETEEVLRKMLPKRCWSDFNDLFVTFGQNVCIPVHPRCTTCPVLRHCRFGKERLSKF